MPLKGLFRKTKAPSLINDNFQTFTQLQTALRQRGLEKCQLIVGVDFTKSNTWQGGQPYHYSSFLHTLDRDRLNPYQQVLSIMCQSLAAFDDDGQIPAYGFGDSVTADHSVFSFLQDQGRDVPCNRLEGVRQCYDNIISQIDPHENNGRIRLSGPTSFVPLINKAIEIVQQTREYHILVIICDGAVTDEEETAKAIARAAEWPLSIVCIGVGKGPWNVMETFDDKIPKRKFDNFQFVPFYEIMQRCENREAEFAKHALMEIPEQWAYIQKNLMKRVK